MEIKSTNAQSSIILGVIISVGFIISVWILSDAVRSLSPRMKTIEVKGMAEKKIISDYAIWTGSFSVDCTILTDGYNSIQNQKEKVLMYLERKGVNRKDVSISALITNIKYQMNENGYPSNIKLGYQLEQRVSISSKDINLITKIANESTELIQEGIEFISYTPNYYYTKLDALKIEMLGEATKDATQRAKVLAENSGGSVGSLASAYQGVFQITPANSTEISDYGMNDDVSIEKSIKAVVTLQFFIK